MNAAEPDRFVYTARTTNWFVLVLAVLLLVPLLVGSGDGIGAVVAWAVAISAIFVGTFSSLRATAGPAGVTAHFGVLGWPRFRYRSERIASVEIVHLPGGLTYGPSWSPRRGLSLALGEGPAIRLTLTNGRHVSIATPDPATAVAALRRGAGPS